MHLRHAFPQGELSRFDNSQNVKMSVTQFFRGTTTLSKCHFHVSGIPETSKRRPYALPYRTAPSFTRQPIVRLFVPAGPSVHVWHGTPSIFACQKPITVLRRPRAGKLQQIELSSDFVGHSWPALATSPALAFQAEPELFVRIKLSHKLLNTSLLWRNVVFKVHDRMRLCHGPPPAVFQHRSGGDDRTKTRHRPFLSQSHSFSMACREDNRPGGSSDVLRL